MKLIWNTEVKLVSCQKIPLLEANSQFGANLIRNYANLYLLICSKDFLEMFLHDGTYYYMVMWLWKIFLFSVIDRLSSSNLNSRCTRWRDIHWMFFPGVYDTIITWPGDLDKSLYFQSWIRYSHQIWTAGTFLKKELVGHFLQVLVMQLICDHLALKNFSISCYGPAIVIKLVE